LSRYRCQRLKTALSVEALPPETERKRACVAIHG
jgi:hypothetical protein